MDLMPDLTTLLAVYGAFIVGLLSPGPDFFLVTTLALGRGSHKALLAAAGITFGVGLWVVAAATGLGTVISTAPVVWDAIRFIGGGLLIYLGARALSAAIRDGSRSPAAVPTKITAGPFLLGLATNLANPKAAIVLVGLTAVLAEDAPETGSLVALVLGMPLLTLAWFSLLATILARPLFRDRLLAQRRLLDAIVGLALAGVGVLLIQTTGATSVGSP